MNKGYLWLVFVLAFSVGVVDAQDMVGGVVTDPPAPVAGDGTTLTGTYENLGPVSADGANMAYVFGFTPVTATPDGFDAVVDSAAGTDTMGNDVFWGALTDQCNHMFLELQQPNPDGNQPMYPIPAGAGGSFSFRVPVVSGSGIPSIPMAGVDVGRVIVTEPEDLRNSYEVNMAQWDPPYHNIWANAGLYNLVSQGGACDDVVADCSMMESCFGRRLWQVEPFEEDVVIALDGSADHVVCVPWTNGAEVAGKIAIVRRGGCQFFDKADNAQVVGAAGMIVVNATSPTGQTCAGEPTADPQECVITLGSDPGQGATIDLPFVMMSMRQGEELFSAIDGAQTVRVAMGAIPSDTVDVFSWAFEPADPNVEDNLQVTRVPLALLFMDSFESGDTSAWSAVGP